MQLQALSEQKSKKDSSKRRREKSFWAELTPKKVQEAKSRLQHQAKADKGKEREESKTPSPARDKSAEEDEVAEEASTPETTHTTTTTTTTTPSAAGEHGQGRLRGGHVAQMVNIGTGADSLSVGTNFDEENHLRLFAQATELMLAFDKYAYSSSSSLPLPHADALLLLAPTCRLMWLFAPLHPAIIHEENIRLALSARHDEHKYLTNPLLLHVHAALAFGTHYLPS
jgi:hypothetical protein